MISKVNFVKNIKLVREKVAPELLAIKATGIAELKHLLAPVLVSAKDYDIPPEDGIYELDFVMDDAVKKYTDVELEVDVVFKFKNIPEWVKGIKINAKENSDIELI